MTTFTPARLTVLASAAALALAGCATASTPEESVGEPEPSMSATHDSMAEPDEAMSDDAMETDDAMSDDAMDDDAMADEPAEVPEQLQWTAETVAGGEVAGEDLLGTDAILWVWASWCPVCQAEAPDVAAASTQLPEGVTLYGLAGKSDAASAEDFVDQYGLDGFEHLFDEEAALWANFGVSYQPAFVLINDDGTIDTIPGSLSEQGILDAAEQLAQS